MEIKDLNITTDIFELYNYTLNEDARGELKNLLAKPLATKEEILERQNIFKGFLANISVFDTYSYSRIDFRQVYIYIKTFIEEEQLPKRLKLKLQFSKIKRYQYRGQCIQLILLYHRLHNHYVRRLNIAHFPETYKKDIRLIDDFFNSFRLDYYENLIRENNFRLKHIIKIIKHVAEKKSKQEIEPFLQAYTLFEAYLSAAQGINKYKFSFPEITDGAVSLTEFYHPLVKRPIKNSFTSQSNVILITGPNMSGKSTLLKAISLCIYLGNAGFAIPASGGRFPKYNDLSVFINLNDDLQSGYSHFMTEVINLKNVIRQAATNTANFAVFDELFRGTNIEDALDISKTTLKGLLNFKNSLFFISSHLHQLTEMQEIQKGNIDTYYLDSNLEGNIPAFTYSLKPGWSDIKIGRILFEKEGLNEMLTLSNTTI